MLNIKEVWYSEEYNKLRGSIDTSRLAFLTFGGSHAYGTNLPSSDIDLRGVMLNTPQELTGLSNFSQKQDVETDTTIYSFNRLVALLLNCNPNCIELLGCKPESYIIFNDIGKELLEHKDWFLSKKAIYSFGGYATAQLRRLQNANAHDSYDTEEKEQHILKTLKTLRARNLSSNQRFADKIDVTIQEDTLQVNIAQGNYSLRELTAALTEFNTVAREFDKLNHRNSKKDDTHLAKHAMHLVRLYHVCFDILEKGEITTFRVDDHDLLMSIRKGEYSQENGRMKDSFFDLVTYLEKRLAKAAEETKLPKLPDYRKIEEWVMSVNKRIITGDIKNYAI